MKGIHAIEYNRYFKQFPDRYHVPPNTWISCSLESRELLKICLDRLKGLKKLHIIDASFIWTEPHSKRIKVKLKLQKEVGTLFFYSGLLNLPFLQIMNAIIQQLLVVEYTVQYQMCEDCHRREAQDFWRSVIQIRQKAKISNSVNADCVARVYYS